MKSPKEFYNEIQVLRGSVTEIRDVLFQKTRNPSEPTWGIGKYCVKTVESLDSLLDRQIIPEHYKVAVVGRFKAGKSSFINQLLEINLAGVNSNPETAAVTTFKNGKTTKATITFLKSEDWQKIKEDEDPRAKNWETFIDKTDKTQKDGSKFDLPNLEKDHVRLGGHRIEILLGADKDAEKKFRQDLKKFTSSSSPLHCLVEKIEIETPAKILEEGVLLIDTPGLDDTERFRVSLTEEAVKDVDSILFLTKSGVAYGQSEKDFLITLLRKGLIKQLIVVITQIDSTYDQHLRDADLNDDDPQSITEHINEQEQRIRDEINKTLDELIETNDSSMHQYREQLDKILLVSTSVTRHQDWKAGKPIEHKIDDNDPGGMEETKKKLLQLLSNESRLTLIGRNIATGTQSALSELHKKITARRTALRDINNGEEARRHLATFRQKFETASEDFQLVSKNLVSDLKQKIEAQNKKNSPILENIELLAEREIEKYAKEDNGRHWATRRAWNWGSMRGFEGNIANQIFPKVQEILTEMREPFNGFLDDFKAELKTLSDKSSNIVTELELDSELHFNLSDNLNEGLDVLSGEVEKLISEERTQITTFLDDFRTEELISRLRDRRKSVADIGGTGTQDRQIAEVNAFYDEGKTLLKKALSDHLNKKIDEFSDFLMKQAQSFPDNAINEIKATLDGAEQNILAAEEVKIGEQRDTFERECDVLLTDTDKVLKFCKQLLGTFGKPDLKPVLPNVIPTGHRAYEGTWFEEISNQATVSLDRYCLNDGDSQWPLERIFSPKLFSGCLRITLIDPYLAAHHQIRNLKEFLLIVAEAARPKEILVLTSDKWNEGDNSWFLDQVGNELFKDFGTVLTIKIDQTIHDRCVVCDHGLLFKLGRGLDIYKPATGLASHRPSSRRVRRTEIDVFSTPEFINKDKQ